jgi:hypothetical protein
MYANKISANIHAEKIGANIHANKLGANIHAMTFINIVLIPRRGGGKGKISVIFFKK